MSIGGPRSDLHLICTLNKNEIDSVGQFEDGCPSHGAKR